MVVLRHWKRIAAALVLASCALLASAAFYLRSQSFRRRAHSFVIAQIDQATGLRATLAGFQLHLDPWRLQVSLTMQGLVLHGRESDAQPPLAAIARVQVRLRLLSLWRRQVQLQSARLQQPRFHVYPLADGALNLPQPGTPWTRRGDEARALFAVAVRRLDLTGGELDWLDRKVPVQLQVRNLALQLASTRAAASPGARPAAAFAGSLRFTSRMALPRLPAHNVTAAFRFTLWPDAVRLEQASLTAPGFALSGTGWLRHFTAPQLDTTFHLQAALAPVATLLTPRPPPLQGQLQATGAWHWSPHTWTAQANLQFRDARSQPAWGAWSGSASVAASPAGLQVSRLDASGLGATVHLTGADPAWRGLALHGSLEGLPLRALAPLVARSTPAPASALLARFAALVSGAVSLQLDPAGLRSAAVDLAVAPVSTQPGILPLAGAIKARWQAGGASVSLDDLQLSAAASHLQAQGEIAGSNTQLRLAFQSQDLAALQPLLQLALPHAAVPSLGGRAQFHGTLTGSLTSPLVSGNLRLVQAHWGAVRADIVTASGALSPALLRLTQLDYRQQGQHFRASGSIHLNDYRPTPTSALNLSASLDGLDVEQLVSWAGWRSALGAAGSLSATARLQGSWAHPQAAGQLTLHDARWRRQSIRLVSAAFHLQNDHLQVTGLQVALAHTQVQGELQLGLADHRYQIKLTSGGVALADIAALQSPRLALTGQVRFQFEGAGVLAHPQGTLTLSTSGLHGGGESLGDVEAQVLLAGQQAKFQLADSLTNGSFQFSGSVGLAAPYLLDARLQLRHYDFDAWLRRFTPATLSGHSQVSGSASIVGPVAEPDKLAVHIALDPVTVAFSGLVIHNQGPILLDAAARRLTLEPAHIVAQDTDFTLQGSAALAPQLRTALDAALQGSLQGHINLALVHALHPSTAAAGQATVTATLAGTLRRPRLHGTLTLDNASLAEQGFPIAFSAIRGRLRLQDRRLQIEQLSARTGSGSLDITGYAARSASGLDYSLDFRGRSLRLRYRGISTTGNLQLRLTGSRQAALLAGAAQLTRVGLDRDFDLALFIASLQNNPPLPNPDSLLNRVRLDVHLTTGPQVQLATSLAHLQLQADLRLRGTLADPSVLGQAGASEGRLLFAGNQYRVTQAQVQFANPFRIEPLLDVGLTTTVQQYDITLRLSGPVDKMAITYQSDPPLSSSDVMALLATGQPTQATASLTAASNFAPSEQLLGQALNNLVAGHLQRLFGITQLQVNPDTGALGPTGSGGSITVQQQVSRNLKLTYTQNLASSSQDILKLDWTISRFLGLTLSRDQFGLYGLKFTFRHRAH